MLKVECERVKVSSDISRRNSVAEIYSVPTFGNGARLADSRHAYVMGPPLDGPRPAIFCPSKIDSAWRHWRV